MAVGTAVTGGTVVVDVYWDGPYLKKKTQPGYVKAGSSQTTTTIFTAEEFDV